MLVVLSLHGDIKSLQGHEGNGKRKWGSQEAMQLASTAMRGDAG